MKKKILLFGKSKAVVDDFFLHLDDDFEIQTTSLRHDDIKSHLKYFEPSAVAFCMQKEAPEVYGIISEFKSKFEKDDIPLIIIGNQDECEEFQKATYSMASLVLTKPISARSMKEQINIFVGKWDKKNEDSEEKEKLVNEDVKVEKDENFDRIMEEAKPVAEEKKEEAVVTEEKKHVLVVDDDPMMLKLIKEQLKDKYSVGTAISGKIALKFLETKSTDLVILDYEMPEENGAQVLEKIRNNVQTASLPIIFLTGIADKEKIKKVLSLKPQGYVLKPIEKDKLLEIIEKTIG